MRPGGAHRPTTELTRGGGRDYAPIRMVWFRKEKKPKVAPLDRPTQIPEGMWVKCGQCREILYRKDMIRQNWVCPKCSYHFTIPARDRIGVLLDEASVEILDGSLASIDPLRFKDKLPYRDRLRDYRAKTGLNDAVVSARGTLDGIPVMAAVMEYGFMGGSMGSVVGEILARAAERAVTESRPLIIVSQSGGARMQEGALSLMQMAKISAALARLHEAHIPFVSILADPTTGGVTASYAMLGDVILAEPGALIGFAGPRVIEQTIRQKLPEGFQRSEFLVQHGMVDAVIQRADMKETLARLLRLFWHAPAGAAVAAPADGAAVPNQVP
jgi:acetyl-CoA carboxylase carboxyl transferase subunit beta